MPQLKHNSARAPSIVDWGIAAAVAVSMIFYFSTSEGARGQVLFLFQAAMKVIGKFSGHS